MSRVLSGAHIYCMAARPLSLVYWATHNARLLPLSIGGALGSKTVVAGAHAMVVLIMGPTGVGKTTIGRGLAEQMEWEFVDGDDFHSSASKQKISRGIALNDGDREPWLIRIRQALVEWARDNRNVVLACSALKRSYREQLLDGLDVRLVRLQGSYALLSRRLAARRGHFAGQSILADQFAILEEPDDAIVVDVDGPPEQIIAEVRRRLALP